MRKRSFTHKLRDEISLFYRFRIKNKFSFIILLLKKIIKIVFVFSPPVLMVLAVENIPWFSKEYFQCYFNNCKSLPFPIQDGVYFLSSLLLTACLVIHEIWKEVSQERKHKKDIFNKKLWRTELKAFAENIGLTTNDRVSLYVHFHNSFIMIARESPNNRYSEPGRKFYKSGIIEQAFANDNSWQKIDTDPIADYEGYVAEVMTKSNMQRDDVTNLTMDSRYLYAKKISKLNNDPVGVLLIETVNDDFSHITLQCGTPMANDRLERIFTRETRRLSHYLNQFEVPQELFEFEEVQI